MKTFWKYTLARLALFLGAFALVYVVLSLFFQTDETMVLFAALIGLVVSAVVSFVALRGMRDQLAAEVQQRAAAMTDRLEESRRAEDVD